MSNSSHRRLNLLTGDWILVSSGRTKRPWQGAVRGSEKSDDHNVHYDPNCYLCPGNRRAAGPTNPEYESVFVFENDFSALTIESTKKHHLASGSLLRAAAEPGTCRVICFSPRHDLTLAKMQTAHIELVVDAWVEQTHELLNCPDICNVQIFENKGALMGCSNPHPHGQIWAQSSVPSHLAREVGNQAEHHRKHGNALLDAYLQEERALEERLVIGNAHFVVLVPFWATWPFETLILPKDPVSKLSDLGQSQRRSFADIIRRLTVRYDNLFETEFPYSAGIHQASADADHDAYFRLHMHFYPPLLRSATVQKFMVGYELLGEAQRDISPEQAAELLRKQSEVHYLRLQRQSSVKEQE